MSSDNLFAANSLFEVKEAILAAFEVGRTPAIWGPPGIAKTAKVREVASELVRTIPHNPKMQIDGEYFDPALAKVYGHTFTGAVLYDVRLAMCSPVDLKGVPVYDAKHGEVKWSLTGLFPTSPADLNKNEEELLFLFENNQKGTPEYKEYLRRVVKGLHDQYAMIFLDELGQAPQTVQNAALQLVQEKKSGTYEIPPGVNIVAAGNRSTDRAGSGQMTSALISRLVNISYDRPNLQEWIEDFALDAGINTGIIGFLRTEPELFFNFNPDNFTASPTQCAFACPRSIETFSLMLDTQRLQQAGKRTRQVILNGIAGGTFMAKYMAYEEVYVKIPPIRDILSQGMELNGKKLLGKNYVESEHKPMLMGLEYQVMINALSLVTRAYDDAKTKAVDPEDPDNTEAVELINQMFNLVLTHHNKIEYATIAAKRVGRRFRDYEDSSGLATLITPILAEISKATRIEPNR